MSKVRNVLWADDDALGVLFPLNRLLKSTPGLAVECVGNYKDGKAAIDGMSSGSPALDAMLVDVLIARGGKEHSAKVNLGFLLAEVAAVAGVRQVSFLTVVREAEVADAYARLRRDYPKTTFDYFDKTRLLVPKFWDDVLDSLRCASEGGK